MSYFAKQVPIQIGRDAKQDIDPELECRFYCTIKYNDGADKTITVYSPGPAITDMLAETHNYREQPDRKIKAYPAPRLGTTEFTEATATYSVDLDRYGLGDVTVDAGDTYTGIEQFGFVMDLNTEGVIGATFLRHPEYNYRVNVKDKDSGVVLARYTVSREGPPKHEYIFPETGDYAIWLVYFNDTLTVTDDNLVVNTATDQFYISYLNPMTCWINVYNSLDDGGFDFDFASLATLIAGGTAAYGVKELAGEIANHSLIRTLASKIMVPAASIGMSIAAGVGYAQWNGWVTRTDMPRIKEAIIGSMMKLSTGGLVTGMMALDYLPSKQFQFMDRAIDALKVAGGAVLGGLVGHSILMALNTVPTDAYP
jgi:hypothetical protein